MEQCLSVDRLTLFPAADKPQVDQLWAAACSPGTRKIVVLDDDPTGVQTVHGVSVYTDWSLDSLRKGFAQQENLFFLLTNSRGFTVAQTVAAHREIIANIIQVAKEQDKPFLVVSRSDSTLRGHYPLETQLLREGLEQGCGIPVDGEILCPYFAEGGRYTLEDIHYVRMGAQLVPAAQTEFARDPTFGYTQSNLRAYVEEKTQGAFPAEGVSSISLADLRALRLDKITAQLLAVHDFHKVIVNATDAYDLKVFCIALDRALAQGKQFCFRTAAAFVKALGGISSRPLLTREEMIPNPTAMGGIVMVGSHTQKTTTQLESLKLLSQVEPIALNSHLVLQPGALEAEAARITRLCETWIRQGKTPVVYTNRSLLTLAGDTPDAALTRSVRISAAVQSIVKRLQVKPAFVIAKGGITSSDIGTKALGVVCATVLGQIRPGIPVWQTGEESRFPGMPYIIFPGNVGEADTLRQAVEVLTTDNC